jgi:hypothetical protein
MAFEWAGKTDDEIADAVVQQHERLVAIRKPLEPLMDLVTKLFHPRIWDMMQSRPKGIAYGSSIHDHTPSEARRKFAAGYSSQTASKSDAADQSWIHFVAPRARLMEVDRVKQYMQEAARQVRHGFDRSTFYRESAYPSQISDAAILWGVMTIDRDDVKGRLVFRRRDPRKHWFGVDRWGDINVDHFSHQFTAKQLVEQFDEDVLPKDVVTAGKGATDKDAYREYEVIQAVYDNGSRRTGSANTLDKLYIQYYVLMHGENNKAKTLLLADGVDWRPSVLRFGERLESGYPLSIAMDALTPATQGDTVARHLLIGSHQQVQPPRLIHENLRDQIRRHNLAPNSNTYFSSADEKAEYLTQKIDPRYGDELMQRLDRAVDDRFFIPLFELMTRRAALGGSPPTATQVRQEVREGVDQLTAVIQSGEDDSLEPSVDAVWAYETELGDMPDQIPQELIDAARDNRVPIINRFTGQLALLKRTLRQNQSAIEAMAIIREMKELYPSSTIIVKAKRLLEQMLSDRIGQDNIHTDKEVAEIEKGLAELEAEERQLDRAERMSKIVPAVTKDPVDPQSPAALAGQPQQV